MNSIFYILNGKENLMAKNKNFKRILFCTIISGLFIVLTILLAFLLTHITSTYTENIILSEAERVKNTEVSKMTLIVTEDTTLEDIATALYKEGCITNKNYFMLEAKMDGTTSGFVPGEYTISSNLSSGKILKLITPNQDDQKQSIQFTIPEGYTIEQIGEVLEDKNIVTKDEFLKAVRIRDYSSEYSFLKKLPANSDYKYCLEGYLFPDTYRVYQGISSEEIIVMMLNRFEEVISRYNTYIHSSPYSIHELLTIASIIEQEAKLDEERPVISGVIYNRLNSDMKLQMCSTIQYTLPRHKKVLTIENLSIDSPYNTYLYSGLPIGPICNPGEACLKAALMPNEHDYYYFVLQNAEEGNHYFSHTMDEHLNAKDRYKQSNDINFTE